MKLTLSWLSEFVDLPTSDPDEIRDAFEGLGHEVEEMRLLEPGFAGVVVGRVLEIAPHPDADKVRVCRVDTGAEPLQIVCGAWNFEAGAIVPVALPGARLGDFEIGRRAIRGVTSHGMICSEQELGLGDDHEGIMVLDVAYPGAAERIGGDFAPVIGYPDVWYDISITPNRPDCMSVLGLARELAARFGVPVREPDFTVEEHDPAGSTLITVEDPDACPRFVGREVRDIALGPSPHWMRLRLTQAGVRPINNVVDASNYAMIEVGHPTHAFDLDRLGDRVVVRHARAGERIVTLDEQDRALEPSDIVVADADRPVAIAGVMGGADTEVAETTTRVLIEAAYWNPPSILLTSKRLGLRSEASARFERGMDPNFCHLAADRVAQLLVRTAGGTVVAGRHDAYVRRIAPRRVTLPLAALPRHLGIELGRDTVARLLGGLGFTVEGEDPLVVEAPTRRPDIIRPVDLVEEVARLHGFDNIPDRVAIGRGGGLPIRERLLRTLRHAVVGAGYHEVLTFSFIGAGDLDALHLPADDPRRVAVRVVNPLRDEEGVMRTTLLPGLLKAAAVNRARRLPDVALFETGKVFLPGDGPIPDQPERLGFVLAGNLEEDWEGRGRPVDVRDATGLWEEIAAVMRVPAPGVAQVRAPAFHPGRTAEVRSGDRRVGVVGQIHPAVAGRFGLDGPVVAGELDLDEILTDRGLWSFAPPSPYPPVVFDLAFEAEASLSTASLLTAVSDAGGEWLEQHEIFDVFTGPPLGDGVRSIAIRLTYRAPDRTLTDEEMSGVRRTLVETVEARTGARLRGAV